MKTTLKEFKAKALANPAVAKEYEELSSAYALRKKLIGIRKKKGTGELCFSIKCG